MFMMTEEAKRFLWLPYVAIGDVGSIEAFQSSKEEGILGKTEEINLCTCMTTYRFIMLERQ